MSNSREDMEKIISDFQKISKREEKKVDGDSTKKLLIIVSIIIIVAVVGGYLYMKRKPKQPKADVAPPGEVK